MGNNITEKQIKVLCLRSQGVGNKEIAAMLGVSQHAIHARIRKLCEALNAKNISHAITKGVELGIIGEDNGRHTAILALNAKIEALGLTDIAHDYMLDRFGLSVLSCRPSPEQINGYLEYMTAFIEQIEDPTSELR